MSFPSSSSSSGKWDNGKDATKRDLSLNISDVNISTSTTYEFIDCSPGLHKDNPDANRAMERVSKKTLAPSSEEEGSSSGREASKASFRPKKSAPKISKGDKNSPGSVFRPISLFDHFGCSHQTFQIRLENFARTGKNCFKSSLFIVPRRMPTYGALINSKNLAAKSSSIDTLGVAQGLNTPPLTPSMSRMMCPSSGLFNNKKSATLFELASVLLAFEEGESAERLL